MSESDTMFNEQDRRRCTTHAFYRSKLWQQDHASTLKMQIWIVMNNRDVPRVMKTVSSYGYVVWFQVRATSCLLTSSKSAWKSTPKCTWMCWRVCWSPGAIRWPVADPGYGSRIWCWLTSPKRPRLGFKRNAMTLYPPWSEPAGLLRLVICWEHHQHDLPQHQSQPDRRHPPSIRWAPAGACEKGMLPILDPSQGGDWGWRWLHWIDVSSTT